MTLTVSYDHFEYFDWLIFTNGCLQLNAYGATFRGDNKLLAAGSDEGTVKLFDIKTKGLLRQFVGHKRSTRRVAFINQGVQVVSFSDDATVALWDIPQQSQVSLTISSYQFG